MHEDYIIYNDEVGLQSRRRVVLSEIPEESIEKGKVSGLKPLRVDFHQSLNDQQS